MKSREMLALLQKNGWEVVRIKGSHHQLRHPEVSYAVTVPHPKKDLPKGTVKAILKSAGLD